MSYFYYKVSFLVFFVVAIIRFPFYTTSSSLSAGAFQTFLSACMEKGQVLALTADTQRFWTVSWVWWPPLILRSHYRTGLALAAWISPSVSVINHVWNLSTVASVFCVWSVNLFLFTLKFENQAKGLGTERISFTVGCILLTMTHSDICYVPVCPGKRIPSLSLFEGL